MFELLEIGVKWIKYIIGGSLLAAILAAAVSLFLDDMYLSKSIFLPTNPSVLDRLSFFPEEGNAKTLYFFGDRTDIDRLISLGSSQGMKDYAIGKYKLYEHYEIDSLDKDAKYKIDKMLESRYKIIKNPKGAVELSIADKEAQLAATMANDLTAKLDQLNKSFIIQKQQEIKNTLGDQLKLKDAELRSIRDSVNNHQKNFPKDTVTLGFLVDRTEKIMSELGETKTQLSQYEAILTKNISTIYLIEAAHPAVKKDSPRRSLIVIGVLLFSFITLFIACIVLEQYRRYKNELDTFK